MIEREVQKIDKDCRGNIIALRNQFKGWSPVAVNDVIKHIEGNLFNYHAKFPNIGKVNIQIVKENNVKTLRTDPSKTSRNLLQDLPLYITYQDTNYLKR